MKNRFILFYFLIFPLFLFSQKDSLNLGDSYADDQIYLSVSYSQFFNQPSSITKSDFSYSVSTGFIKDFILNKPGTISIAAGIGYGFDSFNHELKVSEVNDVTVFDNDDSISENILKAHNLEFPIEFRWRSSTANKYDFWRIYAGFKLFYNFSNRFQYLDANSIPFKFYNVSSYNKIQYGLTLSTGFDEFNINVFYGLSPIFKNASINGESIDTKVLKFGLIFYFL